MMQNNGGNDDDSDEGYSHSSLDTSWSKQGEFGSDDEETKQVSLVTGGHMMPDLDHKAIRKQLYELFKLETPKPVGVPS